MIVGLEVPSLQNVSLRVKPKPSWRSQADAQPLVAVVKVSETRNVKFPLNLSVTIHYRHIESLVDFNADMLQVAYWRPQTIAAAIRIYLNSQTAVIVI